MASYGTADQHRDRRPARTGEQHRHDDPGRLPSTPRPPATPTPSRHPDATHHQDQHDHRSPRPGNATVGQAVVGEQVTYTISAKVPARTTVYDGTVTDPLPPGSTFVSADAGFSADGDARRWARCRPGFTLNAANGHADLPVRRTPTPPTSTSCSRSPMVARVNTNAANLNGMVLARTPRTFSSKTAPGGTTLHGAASHARTSPWWRRRRRSPRRDDDADGVVVDRPDDHLHADRHERRGPAADARLHHGRLRPGRADGDRHRDRLGGHGDRSAPAPVPTAARAVRPASCWVLARARRGRQPDPDLHRDRPTPRAPARGVHQPRHPDGQHARRRQDRPAGAPTTPTSGCFTAAATDTVRTANAAIAKSTSTPTPDDRPTASFTATVTLPAGTQLLRHGRRRPAARRARPGVGADEVDHAARSPTPAPCTVGQRRADPERRARGLDPDRLGPGRPHARSAGADGHRSPTPRSSPTPAATPAVPG